ncbi:hypothetical protein WICPIJ_008778 [Wickerhamomyces pijperi]|uniref:Uncharacterized protein n=1 Tax=Wickerhamomyces pijperi TaxID=599730 RepID=A0A9P8PX81_WICPI|nr:hypothetical protein WICPIJ_008778 [Wickerhamomyces pijperi]
MDKAWAMADLIGSKAWNSGYEDLSRAKAEANKMTEEALISVDKAELKSFSKYLTIALASINSKPSLDFKEAFLESCSEVKLILPILV